jgi:riboflavin transporter FmnP
MSEVAQAFVRMESPEAKGGFFIPMNILSWFILAFFLIWLVLFVVFFAQTHERAAFDWVHFITRVAIFAAIATILYTVPVFQFKVPFLPSFLELHFDEVPAFVAGFAYGPWTAVAVIVIKTLIKLPMTSTMGVGELSDLIFSIAFVVPAALIYKKKRNLKGVAIGFAVSTVLQLIVSSVLNVYAMLPFYIYVMGFSEQGLLALCQLANPAIKDLGWTYALLAVLPLNAIKDAIVMAITFLVYRSIHKFLHFEEPHKKAKSAN